jgi:hypothetical protein
MAKTAIPAVLARRHLIEKELSEAQALQIADAYLAEDRVVEALEFLAKAAAGERLSELRRQAVAAGDAFLLRAVARASDEPPRNEEWAELAAAARAAGKERYAAEAERLAHHEGDG